MNSNYTLSRDAMNVIYYIKYWWYNGTQNKNQKTSKTWMTMCYSVPDKQKPSTFHSRKCNKCIWALVIQLIAKISASCQNILTQNVFKLKNSNKLDKFLELFPDEPKMPNYVTAAGSNSILGQLSHLGLKGFTKVVESLTRPHSSLSCFYPKEDIKTLYICN